MNIQTINIGGYANDGTGDDLRTAFQKVNSNFTALQNDVNVVNGENLGTVILYNGTSTDRNVVVSSTAGLVKGTLVTVTSGTGIFASNTFVTNVTGQTTFTISATPTTPLVGATIIAQGTGIFAQRYNTNFQFKSLTSSDNSILLIPTAKTIDIKSNSSLSSDPAPQLSGNLNLNGYNVYNGDIQTTVFGIDVSVLSNIVTLMISSDKSAVDMGNFLTPPSATLDMGNFVGEFYQGTELDFGSF